MTVTQQLQLELPDVTADPLADLDFDRHEARLDQIDHNRARVDPFETADFSPPPPAARCACVPRGIHVTDPDGTVVCWACGREVTRDRTPVQGALCRRALQADPSGEGR